MTIWDEPNNESEAMAGEYRTLREVVLQYFSDLVDEWDSQYLGRFERAALGIGIGFILAGVAFGLLAMAGMFRLP